MPTHQGHSIDPERARLIKRYCRKVGVDPANYSGHSMRSGYVSPARSR